MKDDFTDDLGWTYTTPFMVAFSSAPEALKRLAGCKHDYHDDFQPREGDEHQMTIQTCYKCGAKRGKYKK